MFRHTLSTLLAFACSAAIHAQDATQQKFHAHEILMIVDAGGGFLLCKAKVDGKDVHLLIDNAVGSNLVLPEIAAEIGLEPRDPENQVSGTGGNAGNAKKRIGANVVVGSIINLPQFDFKSLPSSGGVGLPEGARYGGILGNSFLKQHKVCLDLSGFSGLEIPDDSTRPSAGQLGLAYLRSLPIAVDFYSNQVTFKTDPIVNEPENHPL